MAEDLICPECGGVIGGTEVDSAGRSPCSCYKEAVVTQTESEREDPSDTVSISSQPGAEAAPKLCIVCGKNVSGHRRVKDSRGYLCYDCAKAEVKQEKAGTIPCAECGRRMKEAGLVPYQGRKICRNCLEHHREIDLKNRKVATREIDQYERRNVIILGVAFGVLTLIIIWQTLSRLF